jgi:hypothetical protein
VQGRALTVGGAATMAAPVKGLMAPGAPVAASPEGAVAAVEAGSVVGAVVAAVVVAAGIAAVVASVAAEALAAAASWAALCCSTSSTAKTAASRRAVILCWLLLRRAMTPSCCRCCCCCCCCWKVWRCWLLRSLVYAGSSARAASGVCSQPPAVMDQHGRCWGICIGLQLRLQSTAAIDAAAVGVKGAASRRQQVLAWLWHCGSTDGAVGGLKAAPVGGG